MISRHYFHFFFLPALRAFIALYLLSLPAMALAWHDKTHLAVAKAAGYKMWYNAAGPDIAKIKAGNIESFNHWYNNNRETAISPEIVFNQTDRYNHADEAADAEGHLYGAIIASLREYEQYGEAGKYAEYHLVYCGHYIGDLSMPLHNISYDEYNKNHHSINDGIVDKIVLNHPEKIARHMYKITLRDDNFEADLAREIARIANRSRRLGYKLRVENRDMTPLEAYIQLGHSASLLRSVLLHYRKI